MLPGDAASNKEELGREVEVRQAQRSDRRATSRPRGNPPRYTATTGRLPHLRMELGVPSEYWPNVPPQYIPFRIYHNGREEEVRYVTIVYENDPYALGMATPGQLVSTRAMHVAPRLAVEETPYYTHDDTHILCFSYPGQLWVDNAIGRTQDNSL